jgi:2-polyprenyl-6-methoxyphenol hydroxylase-like FAD-dependent oxidoreductase
VLAGELGDADSLDANRVRAALQRYETVMRPYIDRCQDLPNGIDGYLPKSATDIAVTTQVMKWMQRWPFRSLPKENGSPPPTPSSCRTTDRSAFGPQQDSSQGLRSSAALSLASAMR